VEVVGLLVEEVAGVGALVAAGAVVGAAQVSAGADALVGPALPEAVGVQPDGYLRRLVGGRAGGQRQQQPACEQGHAGVESHGDGPPSGPRVRLRRRFYGPRGAAAMTRPVSGGKPRSARGAYAPVGAASRAAPGAASVRAGG